MKGCSLRVRRTFDNTRTVHLHSSVEEEDSMSADCFYGGVLIKLTVTVHGDIDLSVTNNFIFRNSNVSHKKIHKEIRRSVVCIY